VAIVGGTAEAAKHYLITSTTQIKPRVLKALRGRTGATGASGATGATGQTVALLPSGKTETGVYFAEGTATITGDLASASISFAVPLASSPTATIVPSGTTTADCPGSVRTPTAAAGALCVYIGAEQNVGAIAAYDPFGDAGGTASPYGAGVVVDSTAAGNFYSDGTWAVTAR
jgi:hypothetical protein